MDIQWSRVVRTIVIHKSLNRKILVMGGDRELVMLSALIALVLGVGGMTIPSGLAGLTFWTISLFIFQKMAKEDQQMFQIWLRHRKQQDYYPARSTPWGR
ncbi:Conjugal transfer TrbD family protein [Maridesulfovibrio hydrothermalis AM13 = DSM 14728]|uniref:Conjugal transfer TrbD family protein n=1 Tax=Maridesulfovibrio hydrothermalis AM13 = DSM 14728 TaxID=1121451 RepID=L0RCS2_9BACT|nr:Conjugal transfer TrbD family protein [Maridesulfovibrio hydrothermalis AM13 = DSM 14728]